MIARYIAVFLYAAMVIFIGVKGSRKTKSFEEQLIFRQYFLSVSPVRSVGLLDFLVYGSRLEIR
jgi:hypothetical protein